MRELDQAHVVLVFHVLIENPPEVLLGLRDAFAAHAPAGVHAENHGLLRSGRCASLLQNCLALCLGSGHLLPQDLGDALVRRAQRRRPAELLRDACEAPHHLGIAPRPQCCEVVPQTVEGCHGHDSAAIPPRPVREFDQGLRPCRHETADPGLVLGRRQHLPRKCCMRDGTDAAHARQLDHSRSLVDAAVAGNDRVEQKRERDRAHQVGVLGQKRVELGLHRVAQHSARHLARGCAERAGGGGVAGGRAAAGPGHRAERIGAGRGDRAAEWAHRRPRGAG
mmetsp:Transcript_35609/g.107589  ORF Transcript_35609/g.107589 Transcript_35609/m.107589 type:complete len:280 (-) Transcript_35609:45-884(-)